MWKLMSESSSKNQTGLHLPAFISCLLSARFITRFEALLVFSDAPYLKGLQTRDSSAQPSFTWTGFSIRRRCKVLEASSHFDVRWKWCCQSGLRYLQSAEVVKTLKRCHLPLWPFSHEHVYKIMTKHVKFRRNGGIDSGTFCTTAVHEPVLSVSHH